MFVCAFAGAAVSGEQPAFVRFFFKQGDFDLTRSTIRSLEIWLLKRLCTRVLRSTVSLHSGSRMKVLLYPIISLGVYKKCKTWTVNLKCCSITSVAFECINPLFMLRRPPSPSAEWSMDCWNREITGDLGVKSLSLPGEFPYCPVSFVGNL